MLPFAVIHRALPECWLNNDILRTEQPFVKPLMASDGKPAIQGPNHSSIVRHDSHDSPQKSILTKSRSISHLPTARVASSEDRIDSTRIHGMKGLLALLTIPALEPFPIAKSQNLAQAYRISQKFQNARLWNRQTLPFSDYGY